MSTASTEFPEPFATAPRCHVVMPCAGSGARAGTSGPKQYESLAGLPLVVHTVSALREVPAIHRIVVVIAPDDAQWPAEAMAGLSVDAVRCGGASRAESVFNGLAELLRDGAPASDWVLVHDAARCLITPQEIQTLISACMSDEVGGLLAMPLPDTLKSEAGGRVQNTIDRAHKWLAQTPQMFRLGALHAALQAAQAQGFAGVTDESSAMERLGHRPRLVEGRASNFKVTYPHDFALAEAILRSRS